jgi:group I intron endonuclease
VNIYKITNINTGRVYIGLTDNPRTRWRKHKNAAQAVPTKTDLMRNMRNAPPGQFKFEVLETLATYEEAIARERHWIAKFKKAKAGVYNQHPGGTGIVSYEAREKIGRAQRGMRRGPMSAEHRAKIAEAMRGKSPSAETREKIAAARRGKPLSEEHRAKLGHVGSLHSMSRLHERDIPIIRDMRAAGMPLAEIAAKFAVSMTMISRIAKRKSWTHV